MSIKARMSDLSAISPDVAATTVASMQQAGQAAQVSLAVARKALDIQAQAALSLIDALPSTALAAEGSLGTRLNTWA
jgi:hypothetical protein